jgi:hypothetical protein
MIGYAEREIFTAFEKMMLEQAVAFVSKVPYEIDGEPVRCHELARAVGSVLGLTVQDGRFGFVEHSWLWLSNPRPIDGELHPFCLPRILDPYVPGSMPQVQIVDTASGLPARYLPAQPRTDVREDVVRRIIGLYYGDPITGSEERA